MIGNGLNVRTICTQLLNQEGQLSVLGCNNLTESKYILDPYIHIMHIINELCKNGESVVHVNTYGLLNTSSDQ